MGLFVDLDPLEVTLTVRIRKAEDQWLDALAKSRKCKKADLVRESLREFAERVDAVGGDRLKKGSKS